MTDSLAFATETRAAVKAGGRFQTARQMQNAGEPYGVNRAQLYFRGRAGAVGDIGPVVVTALFGVFSERLVEATWQQTAALSADAAADAYATACWEWGRTRVAGLDGAMDLAVLAERIIDAAEASALVLFAAWRPWQRPADPPARAAHAVTLLRELRGGLYFCALRTRGIDAPLALIADPEAGAEPMRRTGWSEDEIAALQGRAAAIDDLAARWAMAEQDTNVTLAQCCEVLSGAERSELSRLLTAFEEVSRPPSVVTSPPAPA